MSHSGGGDWDRRLQAGPGKAPPTPGEHADQSEASTKADQIGIHRDLWHENEEKERLDEAEERRSFRNVLYKRLFSP